MSVEQIYIKGDPERIIRALSASFERKGWVGGLSTPVQHIPLASRDFDRKRSRHFVLSTCENCWNALVEAGELADWRLAQKLANELRDPLLVIALHESMNAWAYAHFEQGKPTDSAFKPHHLFSDIEGGKKNDVDWDGDAWVEAHAIADKYGLPDPFLSYQQIAKNPKASNMFLTFHRQE